MNIFNSPQVENQYMIKKELKTILKPFQLLISCQVDTIFCEGMSN